MKIRSKIYVSTLVITISVIGMLIFMQACKIGGGNIGFVTIVSHNLDKAVFQQYADSVLQKYSYQVPENLQNYTLKYDFFQVYNFYFNDKPEAIYRLKYSNFLYNTSIYYPENSKQ